MGFLRYGEGSIDYRALSCATLDKEEVSLFECAIQLLLLFAIVSVVVSLLSYLSPKFPMGIDSTET